MTDSILFLGATGRVGRLLHRHLDANPRLLGNGMRALWHSRRLGTDLNWSPGETAPDCVASTIVAFWGTTSGDPETLATNTTLALAALDLACDLGAQRVIHCSSAAVYRGGTPPFSEARTSPCPGDYGQSKIDMETAISNWHADRPEAPVHSLILRLSNVAGADMLFGNLLSGRPVILDRFPDGRGPRRGYVAPRDLLKLLGVLARAPQSSIPAILNVAGPVAVDMAEIVTAAGEIPSWQQAPAEALQDVCPDTTALTQCFGPMRDSSDPMALVAQGIGT